MKLITRQEIGLRPARGSTALMTDSSTGHYGGAGPGQMEHEQCLAIWRAWQNQHMDTDQLAPGGAADIAYNMGGCQHGWSLQGRGFGVRSAANGSSESNGASYAIVFIGGGSFITDEGMDAMLDCAEFLGTKLDHKHSDWTSTGCPGPHIGPWIDSGAPRHGQVDPSEGDWLMALTDDEQKEALAILRTLRSNCQYTNDVLHRLVAPFHPLGDAYGGAEGLAGWLAWMGHMDLAIWNLLNEHEKTNVLRSMPAELEVVSGRVFSGVVASNLRELSDSPYDMNNEVAAGD